MVPLPDTDLLEMVCNENNRDPPRLNAKWRRLISQQWGRPSAF